MLSIGLISLLNVKTGSVVLYLHLNRFRSTDQVHNRVLDYPNVLQRRDLDLFEDWVVFCDLLPMIVKLGICVKTRYLFILFFFEIFGCLKLLLEHRQSWDKPFVLRHVGKIEIFWGTIFYICEYAKKNIKDISRIFSLLGAPVLNFFVFIRPSKKLRF